MVHLNSGQVESARKGSFANPVKQRKRRTTGDAVDGFTLVELAIILVITGLLIGMGMRMIGPLTKRAKRAEIRQTLNAARETLLGYTLANHVLPQTLAQAGARDRDAYSNPVYYVMPTAPPNSLTTGSICTVTGTGFNLVLCSDTTCASPAAVYNDIAVLLVSKGGNYDLQTNIAGSPSIRIYTPGASGIDDYPSDEGNPATEYDDIYSFISLNELKIKSGCASSLGFCPGYEVWNNTGGTSDFFINGTTCVTTENNKVISTLPPGGTVIRFSTADTSCSGTSTTISFSQAQTTDNDSDCSINADLTDR